MLRRCSSRMPYWGTRVCFDRVSAGVVAALAMRGGPCRRAPHVRVGDGGPEGGGAYDPWEHAVGILALPGHEDDERAGGRHQKSRCCSSAVEASNWRPAVTHTQFEETQ